MVEAGLWSTRALLAPGRVGGAAEWDEVGPVRSKVVRNVADLDAIRRDLEARRDESRKRIATLAKRPERGTAEGFGKRGSGMARSRRSAG